MNDPKNRANISLFLVEKGMPGFLLGQKIKDKCGMRASCTAELVFDNCKVPKENLVGELNKGLVPMMRNLEIERVVLAAMSCGIARRAIDAMRRYSMEQVEWCSRDYGAAGAR
jgi:isovaleryl-CoA dehydrogenase